MIRCRAARALSVLLMLAVVLMGLTGCGAVAKVSAEDERISIVCTTFPQYDWIKNLISGNEDRFSLTLLTEKGGDLHSFQPSAIDIARISECDMLIYVGGESDAWVENVLREAANTDMCTINMMDVLDGALYEEEQDHDHDHEHNHQGEEHTEVEYDEHIWLSLKNAQRLVERICDELATLDRVNSDRYRENCDVYLSLLDALDREYVLAASAARADALVFADRFPFRYMAMDYGVECFAAFEGCSAETEAGFETVAELIEKVEECRLGTVLILEGSDSRLAKVIIENTSSKNQRILVMNSMQSVSGKDIENGISYLSVMRENLETLKQALGSLSE